MNDIVFQELIDRMSKFRSLNYEHYCGSIKVEKSHKDGFDVVIKYTKSRYCVLWGSLALYFKNREEAFGCFMIALTNNSRLIVSEIDNIVYSVLAEVKFGGVWEVMRGRSRWWSLNAYRTIKPKVLINNHIIRKNGVYSDGVYTENRGSEDRYSIESHTEILKPFEPIKKIAFRLAKTDKIKFSKFGGLPNLSQGISWPDWRGRPMSFLCQIALNEIQVDFSLVGLPNEGCLYFFYDEKGSSWGYDHSDYGSWKVVYTSELPQNYQNAAPADGLEECMIYLQNFVFFEAFDSYPDSSDDQIAYLDLLSEDIERYNCARDVFLDGRFDHHILGYPSPIQNSHMKTHCQDVFKAIRSKINEQSDMSIGGDYQKEDDNWILLLQIDSDEDLGMRWGDNGRLFFWIREKDLLRRRFDDVWMILDSY